METDCVEGRPMFNIDDLIDTSRVWEHVRHGTGKGVRVAILDTGVEATHPALEGSVVSCHEVAPQGRTFTYRPVSDGDLVGHGTACAGIIHQLAPEAELHSMRVIGRSSSGTVEQLIHGLRWAIREGFDLVNLSLGTVQKQQVSVLQELVDEAYFKGTILIAAANNSRQVSYPAQFASLIAVDNQSFKDPLSFHFRAGQPVEIVANGIYVYAPSPGGKYRWFTGTSFACPHITGLVARVRSVFPKLTPFQIKTLMWCLRSNRDGLQERGAGEVALEPEASVDAAIRQSAS
ncbi:MAG: S8 family serine peptidase [Planctomycetaceae bacterium]|nr:S8 family serine peptidase [Planctomycetaceae bacterium]